jgi:hypothetical protein
MARERKVLIQDYKPDRHQLMMALNMVGIYVDYPMTDLLMRTLDLYYKKGGSMDLNDTAKLKVRHEQDWQEYFKQLEEKEPES